jgi:glycosyltransferase involved in cell wall biosynthesis
MRLVYVTARYLPSVGGTELHTHEVAVRAVRAGHEVTILTTRTSADLPELEESEGVTVRRLPTWPRTRDWFLTPALLGLPGRLRPDLVHCQGYHTLVAPTAMLGALRARLPYVLSFHSGGHSSAARTRLRPLQWRLLAPLARRADALVAVSRFEADHFAANLHVDREPIEVIPNGTDIQSLEDKAPSETVPGLVVSVGRLERYKGHHRVLDALPAVLERVPDARLRFLGSGPFEAQLRAQAAELGVAERVEFLAVPVEDRASYARSLGEAAVVCSLSEYEAYSIAALEAHALGRPMVLATTTGLGELVTAGAALGIDPEGTAAEVADAIVSQLETPVVHTPARRWTWDDCTASLLELYEDILRRRR